MQNITLSTGNIKIGSKEPFILVSGPCAIESYDLTMKIANNLKEVTEKVKVPLIFKASFDKANRTSINSFRGLGIEEGLKVLDEVKRNYNLPIITDIHLPEQAKEVAQVVDIIQIPAFLCRQTDLLIAAANTGRLINIKKAQFLASRDMENVVNKISTINNQILLTERGTCFGYNNLVVDMTGMIEMKKIGYPVIFDGTHSVQKPGGNGTCTGGNREYVKDLCRAAISIGIAGLFIETHPDPDNALSDGPNMVKLSDMEDLLKQVKYIDEYVKNLSIV